VSRSQDVEADGPGGPALSPAQKPPRYRERLESLTDPAKYRASIIPIVLCTAARTE
jgi:hypothetical protein